MFLAARPTPDEYCGAATPEQLNARWRELTAIASACRAKAAFIRAGGNTPETDAALLAEVDAMFSDGAR